MWGTCGKFMHKTAQENVWWIKRWEKPATSSCGCSFQKSLLPAFHHHKVRTQIMTNQLHPVTLYRCSCTERDTVCSQLPLCNSICGTHFNIKFLEFAPTGVAHSTVWSLSLYQSKTVDIFKFINLCWLKTKHLEKKMYMLMICPNGG